MRFLTVYMTFIVTMSIQAKHDFSISRIDGKSIAEINNNAEVSAVFLISIWLIGFYLVSWACITLNKFPPIILVTSFLLYPFSNNAFVIKG